MSINVLAMTLLVPENNLYSISWIKVLNVKMYNIERSFNYIDARASVETDLVNRIY